MHTPPSPPPPPPQVWVCEFCATHNEVDIVPEEKPTKEDTTFMISAPTVVGVAGGGAKGVDDALVVFCIDVSGSMCVSTEVSSYLYVYVYVLL